MTTLESITGHDNYQSWNTGRLDAVPDGPWTGEPDKAQWIDPATGLDCLMVRNHLGAWCGYVGVPPDHPLHGKGYDEGDDFDVHGGLTFASPCAETESPKAVCHIPAPGRPDNVWWFGFDCNHGFDLAPGMLRYDIGLPGEEYRDVGYVIDEVTHLAEQLVQTDTS